MAFIADKAKWLYAEFGFASVITTGWDAWVIILQRSLRMFAYGTNSLILALFFASLTFTDYQIGLFMTLTLAGDVVLGTVLTLIADKVGRRKIIMIGSSLMIISGTVFAVFENFWILLFAAVVGVISATGGDFGPFRAIEESMISQLTSPSTRADVLSWYVTFSSLGSSVGSEVSGRLVHYLEGREGWKVKDAYHTMFYMYTAMGLMNLLLALCLSKDCELQQQSQPIPTNEEEAEMMLASDSDTEADDTEPTTQPRSTKPLKPSKFSALVSFFSTRLADISGPTRSIMYKMWFLLAVDSMADGMVPYSLTNYYLDGKFHLPKSTLGDITSIMYLLASLSTVFAAPLARRLGLVNTMVFTHVPSSAAVLLFPFPSSVGATVGLLLLRAGLNNMDQAPRSAFIAAAVRPEERTAVMGITSMLRTLAATAGPSITGVLAGNEKFWIAFVAAGCFRLAYDFGLYAMFVNMRLHQHEEGGGGEEGKGTRTRRRSSDEEEGGEMTEMQKL